MSVVTEDQQLEHLRENWDTAYTILRDVATGEWLALPLLPGPADELRAKTSEELRTLMWRDHFARTGPRPTDQGSL